MEDKFEKRLKEFLPYIIIIGIIYLLTPALLFVNSDFAAYLVLIGILPVTALGCCAHYSTKKKNDLMLAFVAPVFFLPAMFLYPIARESLLKAFIYLVAYFLCGYLGLAIGDILRKRSKSGRKTEAERQPAARAARRTEPAPERRAERASGRDENARRRDDRAARPRTVDVEAQAPQTFEPEDPYRDVSLDTSTTEDDIDAILREIHQRRGSE